MKTSRWVGPFRAFAGLLLLGPWGARADDGLSLEALLRQEVQGPSRYAQSLLDAPAAVSVLGHKEAAALGHVTVADMMSRLPGIYITNSRSYSSVGMRGFNRPGDYNGRMLMAIDGFRVNDAIYDQALPEFEFPLVADWIKRVELVHGPGSSIYGGNALFGVVNLVTLDGADAPGLRLKGSLGSFGERRAMLQYGNAALGGGDLFLGLNVQRSRGEDLLLPGLGLPDDRVRGLDGMSYASAFVKYRRGDWRFSGASMVRSKAVATAPYGSVPGASGTDYRDHYLYGELAYDEGFGDGDWRRSLRLSMAHSGFYGRYVFEGETPEQPLINRDEAVARWAGLDLRAHWRGWLNHELMIGTEARVVPKGLQRNYDEQPYALLLDSNKSSRQLGVFMQDLWQLSEHWQLTTGLRVDRVADSGSQWSPRLALVYRPQQYEAIKLMAGRAFRPANLSERFYSDGDVSQQAHPDLRPEQLGALELAWERALSHDLALSLNLYTMRMRDMIELVPVSGLEDVGRYDNLAAVNTRGLDLSLEQRRDSGWLWRASLSLADARRRGERLTNSPRWLFKGHVIAPLAPHWTLATEWQAMDARVDRARAPALMEVNAVLRFTGWARQDLALRVLNLGGSRGFDTAPPEIGPALLPRPGRSLHLDWQYRF
ncbi:MAG: TonB-dependent receptor [Burkholderiaceae bacterium]|nr:TonB-dependent receptor [Burkholderiaceae bacterium]